jgi:hypothetical protein
MNTTANACEWRKGDEETRTEKVAQFRASASRNRPVARVAAETMPKSTSTIFSSPRALRKGRIHKRAECLAIKAFQHGAAQRRLSRTDGAREHAETFSPTDSSKQVAAGGA